MFFSSNGYVGSFAPIFDSYGFPVYVFFIFQAMFCATATTIISGAVAERMSFLGYLLLTVVVVSVIYPLIGGWVWGASLTSDSASGWLASLGFYDFAGATVVHSVGGWVALAAIIFIGPRLGKFGKHEEEFSSSSVTMACLGALFIWIGWLGFNGGSLLKFDQSIPKILLVTIFGGVGGICSGMLLSYYLYKKPLAIFMINGGLIGLIAITGAANLLEPGTALILGMFAGLLPHFVTKLLNHFEIDDAIGAVPVHLSGGIFGTIVTGFFVVLGPEQTRVHAILIQALGALAVAVSVLLISFASLFVLNKITPLRVSKEAELSGLNAAEHSEKIVHEDLLKQMANRLSNGEHVRKIKVNPYSESYNVANYYNQVVDKFQQVQATQAEALIVAEYHAQHDSLTGLLNRHSLNRILEQEHARTNRYGLDNCIAIIDIDYFKPVNDKYGHDVGDQAIKHIANTIHTNMRQTDYVARYGGEEFCIVLTQTNMQLAIEILNKLRVLVSNTAFVTDTIDISMTISTGVASLVPSQTPVTSLKNADRALYQAKADGRNKVVSFTD